MGETTLRNRKKTSSSSVIVHNVDKKADFLEVDGVYYQKTLTNPFVSEEDSFVSFLYKPHTITALVLLIGAVAYFALSPTPTTSDDNIKRGLVFVVFTFLMYCLVQLRDGMMLRPHPAPWRLVSGAAILYLLLLVFALFQNVDDLHRYLAFFYPELGTPLPERSYGDDCRVYTPESSNKIANIWATINDEFIIAHVAGYWGKAVLLRDWKICWILSILFEFVEISFQHWLPNFKECWWDHVIVDVFVCNALGIYLGLKTCEYFQMKEYHWVGLSEIKGTKNKLKRFAEQFTPFSWQRYEWAMFSSFKRFVGVISLVILVTITDSAAFFIKYILWIPPLNMLNTYRVFLWWFISFPAVRELYQYVTDPKCKRLGANGWVAIAIMVCELMFMFKFGRGMFNQAWPAEVVLCLSAFFIIFALWALLYFSLLSLGKVKSANSVPMKLLFSAAFVPAVLLFLAGSPDLGFGRQYFESAYAFLQRML